MLSVDELIAQLGGELLHNLSTGTADRCTTCAGPCRPVRPGVPTVCERCSARELGTTPYVLALATGFHLSVKATEARLERYGPPNVSPKEWLTPRARLRAL